MLKNAPHHFLKFLPNLNLEEIEVGCIAHEMLILLTNLFNQKLF